MEALMYWLESLNNIAGDIKRLSKDHDEPCSGIEDNFDIIEKALAQELLRLTNKYEDKYEE